MQKVARKSTKPKSYNLVDTYQFYAEKLLAANPDYISRYMQKEEIRHGFIYKVDEKGQHTEVMNYNLYRKIIETSMMMIIREKTIQGSRYNLLSKLGYIEVRRIERNFNNPKYVDFTNSILDEKSGVITPVYFTDPDYLRIAWRKINMHRNITIYEFKPCKGIKGFSKEMSNKNKSDRLLRLRYPFYPYIKRNKAS